MALPKYLYNLTSEGAVRMFHSDGTPISLAEADWIKVSVSGAVRGAALGGTGTHDRARELEEIAAARASGEIDPLVIHLESERIVRHLTRAQVAKLAGSVTTRLSDYIRGKAEPKLVTLKAWAAILGWKVMLVPFDLVSEVEDLTVGWMRDREEKIDALRMEKE